MPKRRFVEEDFFSTGDIARGLTQAGTPWTAKTVYNRMIGDPGSSTRARTPFTLVDGFWVVTAARILIHCGELGPEIVAAAIAGKATRFPRRR